MALKTMIMIPTYNERANIEALLDEILALETGSHVLVVDDDSPDETWRFVGEYAERYPEIHLLHRKTDRGRGLAGVAGYRYMLDWGAERILEMDADFSHQPRYIPDLLAALDEADVAIGSRYAPGGADANRGPLRRWISRAANRYTRNLFGLRILDCTSGYRAYRRHVIEAIRIDRLTTWGPGILSEVLWRCRLLGFEIHEVPIVFLDRVRGRSTLTPRILMEGLWNVLRVRFGTKIEDLE